MVNYWRLVNQVIYKSDILLLVLDARLPDLTLNRELLKKIEENSKKYLLVLNKSDLITEESRKELSKKYTPSVFVSSKDKLGGTILYKKIMALSHGKDCKVGVIGYPNVGKSSVINLLKGRNTAKVSSYAGHTRGVQFVRAKAKLLLIDTPGVLQFNEKDVEKQILVGSLNPQHVKEPDYHALLIAYRFPEMFEAYYGLKVDEDFVENVAKKMNLLVRGGRPDASRMGRQMLHDWQTGRIHAKNI